MNIARPDSVTFTDLSRNPRAVAERASRTGRLRVTHRDAPDFYLTAADREERRDADLSTTSRMFLAMIRRDAGAQALVTVMPDVFPWTRHLGDAEVRAFTVELVEALSDAAELGADHSAPEVIAGWRATARIKADPEGYQATPGPTEGDYGPVEAVE
ncbi:hypothetical protein E1283_09230 [Streptomyces hainanensis]|uniref:Prevent-host-death family protein n=2 Tax=Streptomyces hainanensis TaxID=402648 RepID=A0A4R4TNF0_9ACTN|nr:hypothetical protein E1283_09230 [Streptomyces hainanensis]